MGALVRWVRPYLLAFFQYAFAFLVSTLYWPGVAGAATTPRWALMALVVPWLLREQPLRASHVAAAVFAIWAAFTLIWTPNRFDGIGSLLVLFVLACLFCLGSQTRDLRRVYIGFALGVTVSSGFAVAQYLGYAPFGTLTPVAGLYINRNFMAEAAALVAIALVCERLWWFIPGLLPAIILPEARGALLGLAVALAVQYRAHWRILLPVAAVAVLGVAYWTIIKLGGSDAERSLIWRSAAHGITLFGHGVGSFWSTYPSFDLRINPASSPEHAHNEFIDIAFELGLVGLVLFCIVCLTLVGPLDTVRLVLIGLLVESCFEFPIHMPSTAFLGMVVAGHAVRDRYVLRDLVNHWRGIGPARMENEGLYGLGGYPDLGGPRHAVRSQV